MMIICEWIVNYILSAIELFGLSGKASPTKKKAADNKRSAAFSVRFLSFYQ